MTPLWNDYYLLKGSYIMLIIRHEIGKDNVIQIGDVKLKIKRSGEKCVKVYIDAPKNFAIVNPNKSTNKTTG